MAGSAHTTPRVKIAYLFSRYPVPSQTFCDTEIRALEAAGHEVEIYSCSAPTTSFRHGRADRPRAQILYAPPPSVLEAWELAARGDGTWPGAMVADHEARFGSRYDPARRARHALYFADRLRRRGVEHLHVHFANRATHAALFIRALTGVPFSFTAHAQDFLVDLGNDDLLRLMCTEAAFVVAVSDWSRAALLERCPEAADKVHRIYNGLTLDRWRMSQATSSLLPDPGLNIFSVGRLIEFKGFQDLLAACGLLKERGVPFSCEIAGDGPLRRTLEQQAAAIDGPGSRVRLPGLLSQEQVRDRMEACDVFALACRVDENGACDVLPTVILEAMACAKPVVSTRLAGVPEMVEPATTGLLVPPGDPAALAEALADLAPRRDERQSLGRAGRLRVEEKFSAQASARQLGELFAQAAKPSAFPPFGAISLDPDRTAFCLLDHWPLENNPAGLPLDESALRELRQAFPAVVLAALKPGDLSSAADPNQPTPAAAVLRACEFLPDAVVFETYWRDLPSLAHQMESWRGEVGGAVDPDDYLLACRRALYLRQTLLAGAGTGRHLHAAGASALLCVWLLWRLEAADTASFYLPARQGGGAGITGSTLRKLSPVFTGGWTLGERKLAASLGPNFRADLPDRAAWVRALSQWSAGAGSGAS